MLEHGASRSFCVNDFGKRCNDKETEDEETNFVKWEVWIVKAGFNLFVVTARAGSGIADCFGREGRGTSRSEWGVRRFS